MGDLPRLTALSRSIRGRVAIVTGAGSGMGRATAQLFADEGAHVVASDLDVERVGAVVDEIRAVHGDESAHGIVCDVADPDQLRALVEGTVARFGAIDIVVNNAGVFSLTSILDTADHDFEPHWARTLEVNLTAQVRLVRFALPHLMASDAARIVNIASSEATLATAGGAAYTASKSAVVGLTKSMAVELGRHGVNVNCVAPGPIETAMTEMVSDADKDAYARRKVPLRRYGRPEEVAHMTLALCLPAASYVNGAVVAVDGGMTVRHT
jgi:3-oxoacyl-[acyl-carrier protein] reductase